MPPPFPLQARRVSSDHRSTFRLLGQRRKGGRGKAKAESRAESRAESGPRVIESTLVSAWVSLDSLLSGDGDEKADAVLEMALQFDAVPASQVRCRLGLGLGSGCPPPMCVVG